MELLPIIYLMYMFISIYLLTLYFMLYFNNKKTIFDYPKLKKKYSVSFVIPAWNEGGTIAETIENIFALDYDNISQVIVVNDGSTDNTKEVVMNLQKKYPKIKLINNKKNTGNAAGAKSIGAKYATGELIVFTDADSYPAKDSLKKMVGFFDEEKVGAVTCVNMPRNPTKFFEKIQAIEYSLITFTRKLMGYMDAIYVVPGPLGLYRRSAFEKVNGFDTENMTEDIEIIWNMTHAGYERKMCLSTYVLTTVPTKLKEWYIQRKRWNIGGVQCLLKYRGGFFKKGMLGLFILPFFTVQYLLGLFGMGVLLYLVITKFLKTYLFTAYSIPVGTALLTMNDLHITASFLNYLGIILFVVSVAFTLIALSIMRTPSSYKHNPFNLLFFSIIYLAAYPFILVTSIYSLMRKNYKWR